MPSTPPRALSLPPPLAWILGLGLVAAPLVWLLPMYSFPVGYDVWWNLFVARTWAAGGFPEAMPAAGWTSLAESFGSRQYGFVALLAEVGGPQLDERMVAPMCWGLALAQGAALAGAIRWLRPTASPLWLALLPALSTAWLFRATALRDLLLGQVFLILLLAFVAKMPRTRSRDLAPLWLSYGFTLCHGAVVLPLVLATAVCCGRGLDNRRGVVPAEQGPGTHPLRPLLGVLAGCALGVIARPDAPAVWPILWSLNVEMPWAALTGSVTVRPQEFQAYGLWGLLSREAPMLLAGLWIAWGSWTKRIPMALGAPTSLMLVLSLFSMRLFEVAAPLVLWTLAASARPSSARWLGGVAAVLYVPFLLWHGSQAQAGVHQNQLGQTQSIGAALNQMGKEGDVVYVTDWGMASPLAWFTRDTGLVFTGMTDPVLMHSHDPKAHRKWEDAKLGKAPVAFTALEHFKARFLVYQEGEGFWGKEPGSLSTATTKELQQLRSSGVQLRPLNEEAVLPFRVIEFAPR